MFSGYIVHKHKSKIILFIVVLVVLGIWMSFYSAPLDPGLIDDISSDSAPSPASPITAPLIPSNTTSIQSATQPQPTASTNMQDDKPVRHVDMLSEDMKQAIRDKLLHHSPKEVIYHNDGRIELPSKGRYTQMPVAVQMPDGSIKIQEYSVLPETK